MFVCWALNHGGWAVPPELQMTVRLRLCALVLLGAVLSVTVVGQAVRHEQCKDPLFTTHWSGKNDIQTLTAFPVVKTSLRLCPAYNQRASCCHETFESEQQKFYDFWKGLFSEKILRVDAHRKAVVASMISIELRHVPSLADREQYEAVVAKYAEFMSPEHQAQCFSELLTYAAGMICFGCKPAWFHYVVLSGESIIRLRLVRSNCLEMWAACQPLGRAALTLDAVIGDSAIARNASRATEDLRMLYNQQALCDWMHDTVGLHPFRLPSREDGSVGSSSVKDPSSTEWTARSLAMEEDEEELDILREGQDTGFDRSWVLPKGLSSNSRKIGTLISKLLWPLLLSDHM